MIRGDARRSLAEVLSRSGKTAGARAAVEEALGLYEAKGAVPLVADTRRRLSELEGRPRS